MINSINFIKALQARDLEAIKKVPKADCHNHSGLGMRFESFKKWTGADVPPPPETMDGLEGMDAYMKVTYAYVSSREGFEYLLKATLEEAILDGVTLIETSIDCGWILNYENRDDFFNYIKSCVEIYQDQLDFRPELGVFKGISPEMAEALITPCLASGLFKSIDFYGVDKWYQPDLTKQYANLAKVAGLKVKIHTGEFASDTSVSDVYHFIKPDALQHGIQILDDEALIQVLKTDAIPLNICPSSNVVLGAVKEINAHPIRALFDLGLKVTINTDDLLFFHRSVSEEFLWLYEMGIFSAEELDKIRLNGLDA